MNDWVVTFRILGIFPITMSISKFHKLPPWIASMHTLVFRKREEAHHDD
jgi:hypothetical protein